MVKMGKMSQLDYKKTPFLVIWETTQACDLVCRHCRACAQPLRHPDELTTEEGEDLLRQTAELGTPIFVLSGGDPLKREDLLHLIRYGADQGLRMATVPAATGLLTEGVVAGLKQAGLSQMALSVDFPVAELHDRFRGVPGAFARSMQAAEWAHTHRLPLQINTTVWKESAPYLGEMAELVKRLGVVFWEVFFLVPTGRGANLGGLTAAECEEVFELLYRVQKESDFLVKVTEAPHYRRYVVQRELAERGAAGRSADGGASGNRRPTGDGKHGLPEQLERTEGPGHTIGLASQAVNAGNGFLFVSHLGDVYPSGFLPVRAGSVREETLGTIYRDSEVFRLLRAPQRFLGRCGYCEFNHICGGSRSRAFALTGNILASEPWCAYRPKSRRATARAVH